MPLPKKKSYKQFDNEKKFLRLENSPPPHNFSNGPSLNSREKRAHVNFIIHLDKLGHLCAH